MARLSILLLVAAVLSVIAAPVAAVDDWAVVYVEDFGSADGFTQTHPNIYIADGQANWTIERSGGDQYVYRAIPHLAGDIRITISGQVNGWTNNAECMIGIGDNAGSGIAVTFGFYGGGCAVNGAVVKATGVNMDYSESSCMFSGPWLWITESRPYSASLTVSGGHAMLQVAGVGAASGSLTYAGDYSTLYVGNTGNDDWPSAWGSVDLVVIEARLPTTPPTGVVQDTPPVANILLQNHPNPFNPSTVIEYSLPQAGPVRMDVYDVVGRRIRTLVDSFQQPGIHQVEWNGTDNLGREVASGAYFYTLRLGGRELASRKATVLK